MKRFIDKAIKNWNPLQQTLYIKAKDKWQTGRKYLKQIISIKQFTRRKNYQRDSILLKERKEEKKNERKKVITVKGLIGRNEQNDTIQDWPWYKQTLKS